MALDRTAITAPFRMLPGLGRLPPGTPQLTPNRPGDAALDAKLDVLRRHALQALCRLPGWDDAAALAALTAQARHDHPEAWSQPARHLSRADRLGWSIDGESVEGDGPPAIGECLRALPPSWRRAGLLSLAFVEDFAVIEALPGGAGSRIPWLAVCLPSHWSPPDKLGASFADVHAPVADNAALLRAGDALTRLVTGPQRWQRQVWTVTPNGHLDGHPTRQPAPPWPADASAEAIGELAWLRSETQTFIPVPGHAQAVFTIKVELQRLRDRIGDPRDGPQMARALHAAIASMSEAVLDYRGLRSARDRLLDWLAERAGGTGA